MGHIEAGTKERRKLVQSNQENFPVASLLVPGNCRAGVLAFYEFARRADDIADSPSLPPEEKVAQLDAADAALAEGREEALPPWAQSYWQAVARGRVSARHGRDLLSAFRQDALKLRYENWGELLDYCMRSAAPVGRAVLELAGERKADIPASDALCNALQVINHMQDIREDYMQLNRVYLPQDSMRRHGADVEELSGERLSPPMRQVVNECLEATSALLLRARALPATVRHAGLRCEVALILRLAEKLVAKLHRQDPLSGKVKLGFVEKCLCLVSGGVLAWQSR